MAVVVGCGALLAVGYLALIPIVSPKLDFVLHDPAMAVGVVLLGGVFGPLNLITDSIFIGLRQARYNNAIVDGAYRRTRQDRRRAARSGGGGVRPVRCLGHRLRRRRSREPGPADRGQPVPSLPSGCP